MRALEQKTRDAARGRIIWTVAVAAAAAFLVWRCRYGYIHNDEPFCLTLAQRLYRGDGLITDEWFIAQNFGAVLLPFYAAFRAVCGSNEGILLCFRVVYCALWLTVSLVAARGMREYGRAAQLSVFFALILFSPLDQMTLSYTSLNLMASLLILILWQNRVWGVRRPDRAPLFAMGLLLAVAVLCCPFFALFYLAAALFALWAALAAKKRPAGAAAARAAKACRCLKWISTGVAVAAVCYIALVLPRVDLSSARQCIEIIFSYPGYAGKEYWKAPLYLIEYLFSYAPVYVSFSLLTAAAALLDRSRRKRRLVYMSAMLAAWGLQALEQMYGRSFTGAQYNCQMLAFAFVGGAAFILLDARPWKTFATFYCCGWAGALVWCVSSDTGIMIVSMTLVLCDVASAVFVASLLREMRSQYAEAPKLRAVSALVSLALLAGQPAYEAAIRVTRSYHDDRPSALSCELTSGPAKGIITSERNMAEYEGATRALDALLRGEDTGGKRFLSYTSMPWVYLYVDMDCASFSSWTFDISEEEKQAWLGMWFELHPDRLPDYIFFYDTRDTDALGNVDGYELRTYESSAMLVRTA